MSFFACYLWFGLLFMTIDALVSLIENERYSWKTSLMFSLIWPASCFLIIFLCGRSRQKESG